MSIYIHVYRFTDVYSHVCALAFIKKRWIFTKRERKNSFQKHVQSLIVDTTFFTPYDSGPHSLMM